MKRCPKCERFGVKYNSSMNKERCPWRDCLWVNKNDIDLNKYWEMHIAIHGTKFKKFKDALKEKNVIKN